MVQTVQRFIGMKSVYIKRFIVISFYVKQTMNVEVFFFVYNVRLVMRIVENDEFIVDFYRCDAM